MKRILILTLFLNGCMGASSIEAFEPEPGCNEVIGQAIVVNPYDRTGLIPLSASVETVYMYPASNSNDIGAGEVERVYSDTTVFEVLTGEGIGFATVAAARGSDLRFNNGLPVKGAPYVQVQNEAQDTIIVSVYAECP